MKTVSFTHYFVQAREEGELPLLVIHSTDEETGEGYYKFMDKKKAHDFANQLKKKKPNTFYRVVKCTETYHNGEWI